MKKLLFITGALLILSTSAFAFRGWGGRSFCTGSGYSQNQHMGYGRGYSHMTPEEQQSYLALREKNRAVYEKYYIDIQQKRLDVERELLDEKPDWKKIGKLNEDISKLEAKMKTEQMKNSYE